MPGGSWTSSDTFTGDLYRATSASPFLGRTFNPSAVTRAGVGQITLRFTGTNSAVMSYSVDGVAGTKQITRQPF